MTTHEVCATGTLSVLDAARQMGVRRVIYAASSSAYGGTPGTLRSESDPVAPLSPYASSKLSGELYCQSFTTVYGLETVRLRFFNIFGPRQDGAAHTPASSRSSPPPCSPASAQRSGGRLAIAGFYLRGERGSGRHPRRRRSRRGGQGLQHRQRRRHHRAGPRRPSQQYSRHESRPGPCAAAPAMSAIRKPTFRWPAAILAMNPAWISWKDSPHRRGVERLNSRHRGRRSRRGGQGLQHRQRRRHHRAGPRRPSQQYSRHESRPGPCAARAGDVRHSQADISLARRDLGYEPRVDFVEGLRRTVAALRG